MQWKLSLNRRSQIAPEAGLLRELQMHTQAESKRAAGCPTLCTSMPCACHSSMILSSSSSRLTLVGVHVTSFCSLCMLK